MWLEHLLVGKLYVVRACSSALPSVGRGRKGILVGLRYPLVHPLVYLEHLCTPIHGQVPEASNSITSS